jgi:hypothetical protein
MIEKVNATSGLFVNEVIEYTGKSINQLTGCTRGTSAHGRIYIRNINNSNSKLHRSR